MNQPLTFKKQKISILIIFFFYLFSLFLKLPIQIKNVLLSYLIVVIFLTYTPSLYKFNIPKYIKYHLFYMPLYLPIFVFNIENNIPKTFSLTNLLIGFSVGLILLSSNITHYKKYISDDNPLFLNSITKKEFYIKIYFIFISVIGEELYFRFYLYNSLYHYFNYYLIIISTFLFVYSHYIQRWANKIFTLKSYIYHGITGIIFCLLYFFTKDIFACIIAHLIFDFPEIIFLYKQTKIKINTFSFNDY